MSMSWDRPSSTSERLAEALAERGMKQVDLVKKTGLNKSIISRCLSGKTEPGNHTIMLLARALGVSEMWLWGFDVPKERSETQKKNDQLAQLVAQLRNNSELFDVVLSLSSLSQEDFASIKHLVLSLDNK